MNKSLIINNPSNNFTLYSLHNIENYKSALKCNINDILNKHSLLMFEYFKFITEKVHLKNPVCNKFIIIRGLDTVSHVFNNFLYYSKNIDLAFYHGQKAFYFYVEFIEQISEDHHTFLQLNSRDASMFVYKKTLFDINNEYRKNMDHSLISKNYIEYFDILHIFGEIMKSVISFLIHKCDFFGDNVKTVDKIINDSNPIFNKICNSKFSKSTFDVILIFIEQISKDIGQDKYIEIIDLFLKKFHKRKVIEKRLLEKIYHVEFYERIEEASDKFISWLFV